MSYTKRIGERVSVYHSTEPIIIIAPHGPDDDSTVDLALHIAEHLNANAIVNNGFEKADKVNCNSDLADCNRISHIMDQSIISEFYDPLDTMVNKIAGTKYIFTIHGFGLRIEKQEKKKIDLILGYGLGAKKNKLTCAEDRIKCFASYYKVLSQSIPSIALGEVCVGKGGGLFGGYSSDNIIQLYTSRTGNSNVRAMQLEFSNRMRKTLISSSLTLETYGEYIAECIREFISKNLSPAAAAMKLHEV